MPIAVGRATMRIAALMCLLLAICVPRVAAPAYAEKAAARSPSMQPVLGWLGVVDLDRLVRHKTGGITLGTLQRGGHRRKRRDAPRTP